MHPVEATGYYTACFIPALWGNCHPVFALTAIIDCAIGAWLGHDGFQLGFWIQNSFWKLFEDTYYHHTVEEPSFCNFRTQKSYKIRGTLQNKGPHCKYFIFLKSDKSGQDLVIIFICYIIDISTATMVHFMFLSTGFSVTSTTVNQYESKKFSEFRITKFFQWGRLILWFRKSNSPFTTVWYAYQTSHSKLNLII